jgi:hypothetical protein
LNSAWNSVWNSVRSSVMVKRENNEGII